MENEILGQILTELKELNVRQNSMGEELMAFQEFTMQKFERLEKRFDGLEGRFDRLENRFDGLENGQKKLNLIIENGIRPSIQVLEDGQVAMQMKLDRIEKRVTAHDEIVFRRVK